ncbi:MAG TPA: DRTGG domain-containing protein [Syntrophobacteraceae bacterium]|nr:DRTGG domain-containing protein [Syntrophobacteraceae bacterium]
MKLDEIKNVLQGDILTEQDDLSHIEIDTVLASDGMSEILAFLQPGALMVTGLTNIQSVRTANFADVKAIVYIRGKLPSVNTISLAQKKGIPVMTTKLGMFDVCGILRERGMKGAM